MAPYSDIAGTSRVLAVTLLHLVRPITGGGASTVLKQLLPLIFVVLVASVQGQGGQGGFGGGGGGFGGAAGGQQGQGGGFGGAQGNFAGDSDHENRTLFLTPGDRTEWTFEAKEHETIFARVTSGVFDPAVAIHDEGGKKLAENDDLEPGNQMAQLVYSLPKPGKYKVVVTNYKGTAGGQFDLTIRRFLALDVPLNTVKTLMVGDRRTWAKVAVDKPGDHVVAVRGEGAGQFQLMRPNGEPISVGSGRFAEHYYRERLNLEEKGTYYLSFPSTTHPAVRVMPVNVRETEIGKRTEANLSEDQITYWNFAVKRDDLVEVLLENNPEGVPFEITSPVQRPDGRMFNKVLQQPGMVTRLVVAALEDGPLRFTIQQTAGKPTDYSFRVARTGKPWPATGVQSDSLDWFDNDYWIFDAKPGDVVKVRGGSPTYVLGLSMMDPGGVVSPIGRVGRTPELARTFIVQRAGRHVIVASGGGIGQYNVSREVTAPKRLPTEKAVGASAPDAPDVWRFSAKKGQDLAFRMASKDLRWSVVVFGPSGYIVAQMQGYDFTRLLVPEDGEYTLVVSPLDGSSGDYTLKWTDLDR